MSGRFFVSGIFIVAAVILTRAATGLSFSLETVGSDMVIKDPQTKLVWQQNTADINEDGIITTGVHPDGDKVPWQEAMDYCQELNYAGSSDWRLPESTELDSLVDYTKSYPAIDGKFGCEGDAYWSATDAKDSAKKALYIHFNFGSESSKEKTKNLFVRCVRNGS